MKKRVVTEGVAKVFLGLLVFLILSLIIIVPYQLTKNPPDIGEYNESYFCDVKVFSLKTHIRVKKDEEKIADIKGKRIRFFTDPLIMLDSKGNMIAHASDKYHILAQDTHAIVVNDNPTVIMEGLFRIYGDEYVLRNMEGEEIAHASFNMFTTYGTIKGLDGTLWADFHSPHFRLDYTVRITDACELDNITVLMLMASFYSDRAADSSNNSSRVSGE